MYAFSYGRAHIVAALSITPVSLSAGAIQLVTDFFCPSTYETRPRLRFSAKKLKIFLKNLKTHLVGGKNPLSECVLRVYLHLFVIGCRVVDKLTVLGEA